MDAKNMKPETLDTGDFWNQLDDQTADWTFLTSKDRQVVDKVSVSAAHTVGFSQAIEVEGKILGLFGGKSTTTFKYDFTYTSGREKSVQENKRLDVSTKITVKPGQHMYCKAFSWKGEYSGEFTSKVRVP